ncbi:acetyl-CoA carboxylase, carboxyltransferase, beta subunit [Campylobacter pinnipediorum subsp. caledonicus]|uniref:Acetyl-coenzyme A carboxylase carboxyl transferase subunit beta n=1 Tax=Campylobacter pinnipediorum subsp. caledonicus TaxID=1874362 RepID=A0A1S6U8L3_9BACT|nr:acetyl-CoA carboxylase, carboxyltransferase subunit beta [Campylobacter pinnipediorum]AQW86388.1 acetyl-CoA carboxylase, carboxyltransferase, beta subunit [Campylobacter pinnipediorum subsp. caledonicus]AQW88040.1 acetyl-CoA carboxylase, carboxyltransferase, beta subunit [Campylobacter pinnipediorum subsp. caledonicus]OPA71485.1 acetyl-CoA carboxylase subunit beta [Campylobacter pinnipediorum subsp. caledonicus]
MSFIDIFSKIRKTQPDPKEAPSHWVKCDHCGALMYYKEVQSSYNVCPKCNYHMRLNPHDRINLICDEDTFVEFDSKLKPVDPLKFVDKKSYKKRILEGEDKTGRFSSVISGEAKCGGHNIQLVVFDFSFMGGSLASVEGEKIVRAIKRALEKREPLVIVSASGGARMQESTFSLMQMSKTSAALKLLDEAKVPYISILTDPTMGGVSASFAWLGDIIIAEPGALIGFAGQRVIKQTIGADLPEGFQRAEFLLEHGLIDAIVPRSEHKKYLSDIIDLLCKNDEI